MRAWTPADDGLHPPESDDLFWTETAWFAFASPEHRLTGYVYPVFRPNQQVCSAGLYIWDDSGEREHEARFFHNHWHLPMPDSLTHMALANGLTYDVKDPGRHFEVRYADDRVQLELQYVGLIEPLLTPAGNHLDQPCRVTGRLCLDGEEIAINGHEMRDKSWSVRSDVSLSIPERVAHGAYTYGINDDQAFLVRTMSDNDHDQQLRKGGWILRDGVASPVVSGSRKVARTPGRPPSAVRVEAVDELGRTVHAEGRTVNRFALRSTPAMVPWISGTTWDLQDGSTAWGEDQEWYLGSRSANASPMR